MASLDLTDFAWSIIQQLLPTKVRGVARSGWTTVIHALVDAAGHLSRFKMTQGQVREGSSAQNMLARPGDMHCWP